MISAMSSLGLGKSRRGPDPACESGGGEGNGSVLEGTCILMSEGEVGDSQVKIERKGGGLGEDKGRVPSQEREGEWPEVRLRSRQGFMTTHKTWGGIWTLS